MNAVARAAASPRILVDTPADGVIGNRAELLTGAVAGGGTVTATCGLHSILLRPCVHPHVRSDGRVRGFWAFLILQELLDEVRHGVLAITFRCDGREVAVNRFRVTPAAAHLARTYPLNRAQYPVSPPVAPGSAPVTVVFPGLGAVGGASLNQLLRIKAHREGWQVPVYDEANVPSLWRAMRAHADARYRWIDGHGCFAAADDLGVPFARVTFVREPVRRLLSAYRWVRLVHRDEIPCETLDDFLASGAARAHTQAAGLLRCTGIDPTPLSDGELARVALERLVHDYALVGVTDRYEESIFLLCRLAGYASIGMWWRVLGAPRTCDLDAVPAAARARLERVAAIDRGLYEMAMQRLDAQLGTAAFGDDLRRYQRDALAQAELPDPYKLRECRRWRALLARGVGG